LFDQAHPPAQTRCPERGGHAAEPAPDDQHVAGKLHDPSLCLASGHGRIPARRNQLMLREMDLTSMYSAMPWRPPSRPSPLSLNPPKGISCVYPVASFTQTNPYSRASLIRITLRRSREER